MRPDEVKRLSTQDLLTIWELTEGKQEAAIATVRTWLLEEMEARNPTGFHEWRKLKTPTDTELRWYMEINPHCFSCLHKGGDCGGRGFQPPETCRYYKKR